MTSGLSLVRLNRNESPLPVPGAVLTAARRAVADPRRYPSWDAADLRGCLADQYCVDPDWVVTGGGSISVIQRAMVIAGAGEILFSWPSFDAFPPLATALDRRVVLAGLRADGSCDLEDIRGRIGPATRLVIICTPNTPTGGIVDAHELREFVTEIPRDIVVLIDEAYGEYVTEPHAARAIDLVRTFPHVMVTRTFSKAYGLAGLRVGYGIAQPRLAKRIAAVGMPYELAPAGEAAAIEALAHGDHMRRNVATIITERTRLAEGLQALDVDVMNGHGNFVWLPLSDADEAVTRALLHRGILVKAYPHLGIRISVGTSTDTDRLLSSWPSRITTGRAPCLKKPQSSTTAR